VSLISPRKEAAIANALAAAAAAAVAGGSAHGNATPAAVVAAATPTATRPGGRAAVFAIGEHLRCGNRKCRPWIRPCTRLAPLSPPPWRPLQLPTLPPPLPLPPRSPQPPATASRPSNCRSGAHDGALELPQRCPRWRQSGPLRPRCGACPSQRPSHRRRASRASWHRRRPHHWRPSLLLRG